MNLSLSDAERFLAAEQLLQQIAVNVEQIMVDLARLQTEVEEQRTVVDSAVILLNSLGQAIRDLEPTQDAINALADEVDAKTAELANAVAANTPTT